MLNENYTFPCRLAFNLIKENNDDISIVSTKVSSRSKTENLKYTQVRAATFSCEGSAVLSVKEIDSAEDYLKEVRRLQGIWGFALK